MLCYKTANKHLIQHIDVSAYSISLSTSRLFIHSWSSFFVHFCILPLSPTNNHLFIWQGIFACLECWVLGCLSSSWSTSASNGMLYALVAVTLDSFIIRFILHIRGIWKVVHLAWCWPHRPSDLGYGLSKYGYYPCMCYFKTCLLVMKMSVVSNMKIGMIFIACLFAHNSNSMWAHFEDYCCLIATT